MNECKKAFFALTLMFIVFSGFAYAANWYFSEIRITTVVDYQISSNEIPETIARYSNVTISGMVTLGVTPVESALVHIFLDSVEIGTTTTNSLGAYTFDYNATEVPGTILTFEAGYQV